ncbi:unnamed protein product, partial [Mesorhabditis belari]|uniref:Uncharacterized protein n=1 Tax=Mesorhabditis belari TaxID=2138241 RepID=A0AAF3J1H6_9BILA
MSEQTSPSTYRTMLTRYKDLNADQHLAGSFELTIHHQMHMLVIVKDQEILQQVSLLNPGPCAYFFKKQIYFESRSANKNYRFRVTLFDESSVMMLCAELGRYIKVEPGKSGYETPNEQSQSAQLCTVKDETPPRRLKSQTNIEKENVEYETLNEKSRSTQLRTVKDEGLSRQLKSQTNIEKENVPLNQPRNEVDVSRSEMRGPNDVGRVSDAFKRWKSDSPREYQLAMVSCGVVLRSFPSFCRLEEEFGESLFPTSDQLEGEVPVCVSLNSTRHSGSQPEDTIQNQNSELDVTIPIDQESDEQDPFNETTYSVLTTYSGSSADLNPFGD